MKFFKKLNTYKEEEIKGAIFGFGFIKAMNYDSFKYGHLLLFSFNVKVLRFLKKIFISI